MTRRRKADAIGKWAAISGGLTLLACLILVGAGITYSGYVLIPLLAAVLLAAVWFFSGYPNGDV